MVTESHGASWVYCSSRCDKDKQLDAVKTVVKPSVESNLKEQFKSYSEAAAENVMVCPSEGAVVCT